MTRLQILISTLGKKGIERVASGRHPEMKGVEYIVSWQRGDPDSIPVELSRRDDFKIKIIDSVGLSRNRNTALEEATSQWVLISDDDVDYTESGLKKLLQAIDTYPEYGILTFRYDSKNNSRAYPEKGFDLKKPPKNYFACSIEIALNLENIRNLTGKLPCFNEHFGLGADFCAGEEDILIDTLLREGVRGRYVPETVCCHEDASTGMKRAGSREMAETKGAVVSKLNPLTWPLRMLTHCRRESGEAGALRYCRWWLNGVNRAIRLKEAPNYPLLWMLFILISAVYGLMTLWTPLAFDDWSFMAEWRETTGSEHFSWIGLWDYWNICRLYDNARIANLLSPFTTLFSPWREIFPWATGIAVAAIIFMVCKMSDRKRNLSPFWLLLTWVFAVYCLPWRDSLLVADYALNYIWAAFITLSFILTVFHFEERGWNPASLVVTLIFAVVAGGWHEGFSFSTLFGFIIYTLVKRGGIAGKGIGRRGFGPQWWLVGIVYGLSAFLFFYCPGMTRRASNELMQNTLGDNVLRTIVDFYPIVLLLFVIIVFGFFKRGRGFLREIFSKRYALVGIGVLMTACLPSLLFSHHPRNAFWPDIFAVMILLMMVARFRNREYKWRIKGVVWVVLSLMVVVPMLFALTWQYRYHREAREVLRLIEESPTGEVRYNLMQVKDLPAATFNMPSRAVWFTPYNYEGIKKWTGKENPAVMPVEEKRGDKTEKSDKP